MCKFNQQNVGKKFKVGNSVFRTFAPVALYVLKEQLERFAPFTFFVKSKGRECLSKEWRERFASFKSNSLQICSFHNDFPLCMPKTKEQNALVALCKRWHSQQLLLAKRATRSLWKEWITLSRFRSQKTINSHKKPKSEFPTLQKSYDTVPLVDEGNRSIQPVRRWCLCSIESESGMQI